MLRIGHLAMGSWYWSVFLGFIVSIVQTHRAVPERQWFVRIRSFKGSRRSARQADHLWEREPDFINAMQWKAKKWF